MRELFQALRAFKRCFRGATAIEYGLIAGGIFLAIATPVIAMGDRLDETYQTIMGYF